MNHGEEAAFDYEASAANEDSPALHLMETAGPGQHQASADLAAEFDAAKLLQKLASHLIREESSHSLYDEILATSIALMGSDMGSIQSIDSAGCLHLLAWKGFHPDCVQRWQRIPTLSDTTCSAAAKHEGRLVVPDVETCPFIVDTPELDFYRLSGIRAIQSTPLMSRDGRVIGMISNHWRTPHTPRETQLRYLDLLARQAADALERRQVAEALRGSEERLQGVLASIDDGIEIIDKDWRYIYRNPAGRRMQIAQGLAPDYGIGQVVWDAFPSHLGTPVETGLRQAMEERKPSNLEFVFPPTGRIFSARFFPIQDGGIAVRFHDVTEQKRREANAVFLAAVQDDFARVSTVDELVQAVGARLGEFLKISAAFFLDIDDPKGEARINHVWRTEDGPVILKKVRVTDFVSESFLAACRQGKTVVVRNTQTDSETHAEICRKVNLHASLGVPFFRQGEWKFAFAVADSRPRDWRPDEIEVFEEISNRFFPRLERARALEALASLALADAFRVRVTDTLRSLLDPLEIQKAVANLAGRHLAASRVLYAEIGADQDHVTILENFADGVPLLVGELRVRDFGRTLSSELRCGRTFVADSVAVHPGFNVRERAAYASIQVAAHVAIPLLKEGKLVAVFAVHQSQPRVWKLEEVMLMEEVAERTRVALERSRAERALRESEEQMRLIVENARDYAIISSDLEHRITSWNPGAEQIFGYTREEILGQSMDSIFTPEDRAAGVDAQETRAALEQGRAVDERWHLRKDGTRFWVSGVMMAMRDADGQPVGFVKIMRDHTEARRTAEALAQSYAQAEAANRAKDHFLAVLSHELRTPLTPVLLVAEDMATNEKLPKSARTALQMIHRNIELEARLIDDLLDLTRITRGKAEISRQPMDLHEVIAAAVKICGPEINERKQKLTVDLRARKTTLQGDPHRLQQVFWNLLKNASKFTPQKGAITISSQSARGWITVSVCDSGIGLRQEMLQKIFNPFEQGDVGTSREYGGLGLGLAIAKATVDAHGGKLEAQSDGPSKGATFTIKLPLQ